MARMRWLMGTLLVGSVGCSGSSGGSGAQPGVDASTGPSVPFDAGQDATTIFATDAGVEAGGASSSEAGDDASPIDAGSSVVTPSSLDFGPVNCGSTAAAQTLTVVNPTSETATWTASLGKGATSAFQLSTTKGTLAPQQSAQVTVTPGAVPATASTSANAFGDVVTVSLGDTSATVTLTETAQGAVLAFEPSIVAFGPTPLSAGPENLFFAVQNSGNLAANVTLTLTGDPSFSLPGATTTQTLSAPSGNVADSEIIYAPTTTTSVTGSIALALNGASALCGPLPSALSVSGTGTNGQVAVNPPTIVFGTGGLVPCGTTAVPAPVMLSNTGSAFYTVSPASGTVGAGASPTSIVVTPKTIPTTSATTAGGYDDTLTITTNAAGDVPHVVSLDETAQGAILTRSLNGTLSFGSLGVGATVTNTTSITFSNTGNVDATLAFTNGNPTAFGQSSPLTVGAGTFAPETLTFTPTAIASYTDIETVALAPTEDGGTTPLCGALPASLGLSGTGVAAALGASPTSLNFGYIPCGQAGSPLIVTITNNAAATPMYTASLLKGAGSYFTVVPTASLDGGVLDAGGLPPGADDSVTGSLASEATVQLTITPKPLPMPGSTSTTAYTDTLQVVTQAGNIVDVALNQVALGAVFTYTPTPAAFGTLTSGASVTTPYTLGFTINNTGTSPATLTAVALTPASSSAFGLTPATNVSLPPSGAWPSTLTFLPPTTGPYTGAVMITPSADTLLCSVPVNLAVTGTGK